MKSYNHCCEQMSYQLSEGEVAILFIPKFREYGIRILDGGDSMQTIYFCPWCGTKLPPSLRDLWFEEIGTLGLEPESREMPSKYKNDQWWLEREDLK